MKLNCGLNSFHVNSEMNAAHSVDYFSILTYTSYIVQVQSLFEQAQSDKKAIKDKDRDSDED